MSKPCCQIETPDPSPKSEKWIRLFWIVIILALLLFVILAEIFNF